MSLDELIYKKFCLILKNRIEKITVEDNTFFVISLDKQIAIGFEYPKEGDIFEAFNNFEMKTRTFFYNNKNTKFITLSKYGSSNLKEFSSICSNFIYLENRNKIINNPLEWWEDWKNLVGNKNSEKQIYSLIAELLTYKHVYKNDSSAIWDCGSFSTHDIETDTCTYEVKSTLSKYNSIIHVTSENQLKPTNNPLKLIFIRMEESNEGISLEDVINMFSKTKKEDIIHKINRVFPKIQTHTKTIKYKILEIVSFDVNNDFPVLNTSNHPGCISHIMYDLDLSGLNGTRLDVKNILS